MYDTALHVQCTDCKTIVPFSFVLGTIVKGKLTLMLFGSCTKCKAAGDKRSLRVSHELTNGSLSSTDRFPIIVIGG